MAILEYMDSVVFDFDPRSAKGRYVYVLSHKDIPFYVGIGVGHRWRHHFYYAKNGNDANTYKQNKINKIINSGEQIKVDIVKDNLSLEEACTLEVNLIRKYGRKCDGGTLTNMSSGGESGNAGRTLTESHKEKIRIASRGRTSALPPELVRKAKLLFHYRGMSPKEIQRLDEFKSVSVITISGWIQKKKHAYISPHLNSFKDMRKEKEQECLSLYDKGFTRKQIHEILGLEYSYVKKILRGA